MSLAVAAVDGKSVPDREYAACLVRCNGAGAIYAITALRQIALRLECRSVSVRS